jgi:hypothetical protein
MKKTVKVILIGAVAIMLMLPSLSLAAGIKVGLKIGMNRADFHGEDVQEMLQAMGGYMESKWGLCAGGFVRFNISKTFAIQPEVLYTMKGAKIDSTVLRIKSKWEFNLSYLEVPVIVKFMIPTPGGVKPNLYAGPSLAIKLSSKIKHEIPGWPVEEQDIEGMKDTDFGLIIGAGIDFGKLMVDLRYVLGLTAISDDANSDIKNRVISLMIGYSF